MSGHQVVVQGIEFQNLVVSASIFCEIEPGIEAERKDESNDKIEIDAETECGDEEPVVAEARRKSRRGLLGGFVSQLASWLNHRSVVSRPSLDTPAEETEVEETELWKEWEWILSEAEKFVCKRSEEEAHEIQEELASLRKNANLLKSRPEFLSAAKEALANAQLSEEERVMLNTVVLDSNKRSKIVTDVVGHYSEEWLNFVEGVFFTQGEGGESLEAHLRAYRESYPDSTYQKGVVGGLKEAGWQASHGPGTVGLTYQILGDILWAFWKMLIASIRYTLDRELAPGEMHLLAEKLYECQNHLIEMWFGTIKNSEFGAAREGELPRKWAKEAEEERKKLAAIKQSGVSARYEYKPVVVLETERKQLADLKRFLETSLHFHSPEIRAHVRK